MALFLLISRYVKPLDEVDRLLPEHRAFLEEHYAAGRFIVSGRRNPPEGGVILARGENRREMEMLLATDPFVRDGVSEYEILEFTPTKHASAFGLFLER